MCPCPAIRHIFCLKSYPTKRHCFKKDYFLCRQSLHNFEIEKVQHFKILFFPTKKKIKNEFALVDLFVNEP